jgi:hypothetical protein
MMATNLYDELLRRARQELSAEERLRLISELANGTDDSRVVQDGRSLFDALEARGLIGFMTNGPGDLSTNPKHMEGFGKHAQ